MSVAPTQTEVSSLQKMTEEKVTCRKTRGNPLLVLLQKGLYTAARQRSLDGELGLISVSPVVSPVSLGWWGERRLSNSSDLQTSSLTSWTRPIRELRDNSRCEQRTSILDLDSVWDCELNTREGRSLLRLEASLARRRDSSADTSRDIEDIEDLELDIEDQDEDHEEEDEDDICDKKTGDMEEEDPVVELSDRRLTGTVTSPDLAYCSMEGSRITPDLT